MAEVASPKDEQLGRAVMTFNSKLLGLALGTLLGLGIFLATNFLVLRGGHLDEEGNRVIGPHLELLGQFFIGYRVTFVGSLIGMAYGFALGTFTGAAIGWIYYRVSAFRR